MKKIILGVLLLTFGCAKNQESIIPYVPINFSANLNDPRLLQIKSPGGAIVLKGYGYAGLILYNNNGDILAYDACSTVNPEKKCTVTLDTLSITVTDPCSGARFLLSDGSAAKAPAQRPLRRYQAALINNNISVIN
ncbi:MAG: hypothetical protein EAZ51_04410 [Sphingobacteriales bacterium]|nr:MAG: hypothetical protein EAZ64_04020 [Sphingobacteriales bacterium]TAF81347.1 MAG: hypothetical protein EAZ51_04410 [Sphingobacteriales bacterium]